MSANSSASTTNAKKAPAAVAGERRRMSSAGSTNTVAASKENKRLLTAVLSEDSTAQQQLAAGQQQQTAAIRQSFLSKLAWAEGGKAKEQQQQQQQQQKKTMIMAAYGSLAESNNQAAADQQSAPCPSSSVVYGTECDINSAEGAKNDLEKRGRNANRERGSETSGGLSGSGTWLGRSDRRPGGEQASSVQRKDTDADADARQGGRANGKGASADDGDDEDNLVIPTWPTSRSDAAAAARDPDFIQHKIYSLKDYSQVASPTATCAPPPGQVGQSASTSQIAATGGKLLKSMSQDRKVKTSSKRMSECAVYPSGGGGSGRLGSAPSNTISQQNPSVSGGQQSSAGRLSMGPAAAFLPGGTRHAALMGESRIDRMRKLFVSPLSLRSSGSGSAGSSGGAGSSKVSAAAAGHAQPPMTGAGGARLSFQSGASMLNKPHHNLMHAVYRTAGPGAHHNRRSPMYQKQGKSFRVYGCPLQMANNIYPITCFGRPDIYKQQSVPYVLARLCNYIEENSSQLTHEGIFRVSGNARLMEKLRTLFDHLGDAPLESESVDVATSASMLKMYLRELPEPLIPTRMNYYFISLAKKYATILAKDTVSGHSASTASSTSATGGGSGDAESAAASERQRLAFSRDLTKLVRKLPVENYNLLKYLACFLYRISLKQQYNKMCAEALGIVFGPNVFRIRGESYKGLREQELSNQVMASIIRNYKSIFDSELTDPLGNLVEIGGSGEGLASDSNQTLVGASGKLLGDKPMGGEPHAATNAAVVAGASTTAGVITAKSGSGSCPITISAPVASTSKADGEPVLIGGQHACCPEHCSYPYDGTHKHEDMIAGADGPGAAATAGAKVAEHENDPMADGDRDADESDDDCDDDEGESYTPSSNTGSYCSSMNSDTIESSYDAENADMASRSNISSSDCGSDTSYTPTSSHTDSEPHDAEESLYGNSSSFESSPSFGRLNDPLEVGADGIELVAGQGADQQQQQKQHGPCMVCKRRESAQLESLNSGGGSGGGSSRIATSDKQSKDKVEEEGSLLSSSTVSGIPLVVGMEQEEDGQGAATRSTVIAGEESVVASAGGSGGGQLTVASGRPSRRRRQADGRHRNIAPLSELASVIDENSPAQGAPTADAIDIIVDSHNRRVPGLKNNRQDPAAASGAKGSGRHALRQAQNKLDFLRRRSSSASSLSRIKHKRDQIAAQRRIAKESEHHRARGLASSSDKRRGHDVRGGCGGGGHGSSRRLRDPKGHANRRTGGDPTLADSASGSHHQQSTRSSKRAARLRNMAEKESARDRGKQLPTASELAVAAATSSGGADAAAAADNVSAVPPNPPAHLAHEPDLGWDYLSAQYLEELEYDRYFLLRSFNSDETLLRSLNYCSEFPQEGYAKERRRFSGHEFNDKVGMVQLCQPCDQIYEGSEEDPLCVSLTPDINHPDQISLPAALAGGENLSDERSSSQPVEPSIETSIVSLIDNRFISSFRKSDLSFNSEEPTARESEDSILVQMEAIKELIKVLRRVLKHGSTRGYYTDAMEQFLLKLCEDPNLLGYSDDYSASHVDYLSARSLVKQLNDIARTTTTTTTTPDKKVQHDVATTTSTVDKLNQVLSIKITLFKQQYNDLKNIRDHYVRNHTTTDRRATGSLGRPKNESGSSDGMSNVRLKGSSKTHGSLDTLKPSRANDGRSGHRTRILSVPNREALSDQSINELPSSSADLLDESKSGSEQATASGSTRFLATAASTTNTSHNRRRRADCSGGSPAATSGADGAAAAASIGGSLARCKFGSLCPVEFVFNIEKQLASKRTLGCRVIKLNEMSLEQLQSEKLELQKNLLRYEHWFGRPVTRLEFSLVGQLYERYRAVKMIKLRKETALTTATTTG